MNLNHFAVLYKIDRYGHKRRRRRVLRESIEFVLLRGPRDCTCRTTWKDTKMVKRQVPGQSLGHSLYWGFCGKGCPDRVKSLALAI